MEGSRVNYEVQGFRRSLKVDGFNSFLVQGLQGSKGQRVSGHVGKHLLCIPKAYIGLNNFFTADGLFLRSKGFLAASESFMGRE